MKRRDALLSMLALCAGCGGGPGATVRDCSSPSGPFVGSRSDGPAEVPVPDIPRGPMAPTDAARFDGVLGELLDSVGMPAISAALASDAGEWQATRGLACTSPNAPVSADTVFYWASVGKSLTAVLVLQLVEAGALRLADTLDRWFPQIAEAPRITLAQLLTHTSGLATNTTLPPLGSGYESPAVLLAAAQGAPSPYCPGSGFNYSNIGYLLLGLVAERVSGMPYHRLIHERIAQPLALTSLRALQPAEGPTDVAVPHLGRTPRPDPGMSSRLGMGNVVARAGDMLTFWRALLCGHLLQPATVRGQWAVLCGLPGATDLAFGQGVMEMRWTDARARPRTWWGHLGGTDHANALVGYDPLLRAFVAVAVNSEASSTAVGHRLLTALEGA